MQKRSGRKGVLSVVSGQVFILICAVFAISFVIGQAQNVYATSHSPSGSPGLSTGIDLPDPSPLPAPPVSPDLSSKIKLPEQKKFWGGTKTPNPTGTNSLYLRQKGIIVKGASVEIRGKPYSDVQSIIPPGADGKGGKIIANGEEITINTKEFKDIQQSVASQGGTLSGTHKQKIPFTDIEFSGMGAHLLTGVLWATTAVGIIKLVGEIAGLDKELTNSLSAAAMAGIIGGRLLYGLATEAKYTSWGVGSFANKIGLSATQFGFVTGIGIAAAVFFLMYKKEEKKLVRFECLPWEPPLGGKKCEDCNKDPSRPCTEYRCKSLGQACDLVNKDSTVPQCVYKSVNDARSPMISPWKDVLSPGELKYVTDTSVRPPAIGIKITSNSGCLPAYTPLKFGITTDEPAQCKIDFNATTPFSDMQYYVGESNYFAYNHTQKMRLPAPDNSKDVASPTLRNDGTISMYIRCQDANGNYNADAYAVSFCVDKGPDTTPPLIEEFSIPSGSFVQYRKDIVPIESYINEPAQCKWSIQSKNYETMENVMQCSNESIEINADLQYICKGNLTGVKDREDNSFFFRCKDIAGNVNVASKELVLKGSRPLDIFSVGPNGTISGSTDTVKVDIVVTTTNGAEDGKSVCSFAPSGQKEYIKMFETGGISHKQTLGLISGNYNYSIRCIDAGGNLAKTSAAFTIIVDKQPPKITRAYRFNTEALKVVTDEDAQCVYSLTSCNYRFVEGIEMIHSPIEELESHLAEWKDNAVYHIKCSDAYDNEPDPNACNLVVSASQIKGEVISIPNPVKP